MGIFYDLIGYLLELVPLNGIAYTAALVVFEGIGKCCGVTAEREVVACVRAENYRCAHVEAVEVTAETGGGHTQVVVVEVVTAGERNVPTVTDADVSADVQCLGELIRIAHLLVIELVYIGVLTHCDTVAEGQRPWH